MRRSDLSSILVVFILILISCKNQVPDAEGVGYYFSMDSLVNSQIEELKVLNPSLEKMGVLDTSEEAQQIHLDSIGWENELKVFRDASIDKPALNGAYLVRLEQQDPFSNLLYDEYQIEDPGLSPVKNLKVFYLNKEYALKKIEIKLRDKNELFEFQRDLSMKFDDREGKPVLSSFEVKGSQKLKLSDSVKYEMKGTLIY